MKEDIIIDNKYPGISRSTDNKGIVFYVIKGNIEAINDINIILDSYLFVQGNINANRDIITNNTIISSGDIKAGRNIVGELEISKIMTTKNIIAEGHIQADVLISKEESIKAGTFIYTKENIKALKSVVAPTFIRAKEITSDIVETISLKCNEVHARVINVTLNEDGIFVERKHVI